MTCPLTTISYFGLLLLSVLTLGGCGSDKEKPKALQQCVDLVSTLAEFNGELAMHAANLDDCFQIQCTPELHSLLMEPSFVSSKNNLLSEIVVMNGSDGRVTFSWTDDTLELGSLSYYAGWRILNAVWNGCENRLSKRERETLRMAQSIVAAASGPPVEKERHIHDALCNRIVYYTNDEMREDKDCAIGALLNGKADCDGYADAMMLCCGLAGIPCRYMRGTMRHAGEDDLLPFSKDAGHMWNLVQIAGSWISVDVTCDDQPSRISYLYYNLGTADASFAYLWDQRAMFVDLAMETDSEIQLMPDQRRVAVQSLDEVYSTARRATLEKASRFTFICSGTPLWQTMETEFNRMLACGGWNSYQFSQSGRMLEVTNIKTDNNPRFCDTEDDALRAIRDFAASGTHSFSLHFRPALAEALFAKERAGLKRLLSLSLLENPETFRYSQKSGSMSLENASFTQPLPVCHSAAEILTMLRRELARRPTTLAFLLPNGFDFDAEKDGVFNCVWSMGVEHYTWSFFGNRIRLLDLEYYGEFCLVETQEEVVEYLRSAHESGKTVLRIYCPPDLYVALKADKLRLFWKLLKEAGYTGCMVYSNDKTGMLKAEQ